MTEEIKLRERNIEQNKDFFVPRKKAKSKCLDNIGSAKPECHNDGNNLILTYNGN